MAAPVSVAADDLRILVMSATMAAGPVAALLGQVPVIRGRGRSYPVELHYLDRPATDSIPRFTAAAVVRALNQQEGDILVFLPGTGEIRATGRLLASQLGADIDICPLYGDLARGAQDRAIRPSTGGKRRLVLATSIAETSLTIEGIRVVVDAGQMRVPRFDGSAVG